MNGFVNIVVLFIAGTMLANVLIHPDGTKQLFNGMSGLWQTGINGVLGKAS